MLADDMGALALDPLAWVRYAFAWGEGELAGFAGPDAWQTEFLTEVGRQVRARGFRPSAPVPVDPLRFSTASGHGIGKAQPKFLEIDTPTGRRRWGDLRPGDLVFGADGKPTRVIARHEQGVKPIYEVAFDDGSSTLACADHVWTVRGRAQRRVDRLGGKQGHYVERTTSDLLREGVVRKNGIGVARQWELPRHGAVEFSSLPVPVDPYVLGVWLGDGGRNSSRITTADHEVIDQIVARGYRVTVSGKAGAAARDVYVGMLTPALRAIGLHDKYSYEKSVPAAYKYASAHERADLLRGLLDTDGECGTRGSVGFCSASLRLVEDVVWLARSLGGKARLQPAVKIPKYRDPEGKLIEGRPAFRATITMPHGFRCFYIERKQARVGVVEERYLTRWIERITPAGEADCMCITVENSDGLYLTNDFIVTHNSAMTSWLILWIMSTRPNARGVVTANTGEQLATKTWAEVAKWKKRCITGHWFDVSTSRGSLRLTHRDAPDTWRCDAITWREEAAEAFAGLHAADSTPFFIFDEASAIPDIIFDVAEGGLTDGEPMIFLWGNPTRNTGRFFETHHRLRHRWTTRAIDSRTAAMPNKAQIQQWLEDYGEDSDFFRVRVRGVFPRAGSLQFIAGDLVDEAMSARREAIPSKHDALVLGVDIARFGDDQTVLYRRRGRDARSLEVLRYRGLDTQQVASRIAELVDEHKTMRQPIHAIFLDEGGVGGGVIDRLRALNIPAIGVNFGARASDERKYANRRAEMWGKMRAWLEHGAIPDDRELRADLTAPEYGFDNQERIVLEKKRDMKARGLASPDVADALALTFAAPVEVPAEGFAHGLGMAGRAVSDYDPFA